jgi:putative intracellular protease/amidase
MKETQTIKCPTKVRSKHWTVLVILLLISGIAHGQTEKPNVAILVYDDVQILDHALPYEMFGQYGLNNVYTVAKDSVPLVTYMGMRIIPNYSFDNYPKPDVLVIPGGDTGEARQDPKIQSWIRNNFAAADHVLAICSGVFFLTDSGLLTGRATTYYDLLDELKMKAPELEVVENKPVVESGKVLTSTGIGSIEASLRIIEQLHGKGWARVARLNKEYQQLPEKLHVPRAWLADMNLPGSIYNYFPWRRAELTRYRGDQDSWVMEWQFYSGASIDSLASSFKKGLLNNDEWELARQRSYPNKWSSSWTLKGRDGKPWEGKVQLVIEEPDTYRLVSTVQR